MIKKLLFVLLISLTVAWGADVLPDAQKVPWVPGTDVGVPGGIDQYRVGGANERTTLIDITEAPYNADNTGSVDCRSAINTAIAAASPGEVVYFPAGTYKVDGTISIGFSKDSITLRGDGPGVTILDINAGTGISAGVGATWAAPASNNTVTAGLAKGATTLTIADTSAFVVDRIMRIQTTNDQSRNRPVMATGGYDNMQIQFVHLVSKTSTTLTFEPGLFEDYGSASRTVKIHQFVLASPDYIGIEDMTVDMGRSGSTTFGIQYEACRASWIYNVRLKDVFNYGIFFWDSLQCEVRQTYIDQQTGSGSNGGGFLHNSSSSSLFENNIIHGFFPLIEVNHGSAGNVIAYNFIYDAENLGSPAAGLDTNHGPHNVYNLYEGNLAPNFQTDSYFGSVSDDTLLRNWFHGFSPSTNTAWAMTMNRMTRDYYLIGNIFGNSNHSSLGYSFGNPNIGNANWTGVASPGGSESTLTTRTDDDTGTITGPADHTVSSSDTIDVWWFYQDGAYAKTGIRRGMTVGTVSGTSIPVDGGTGDVLPSATTAVYVPTTSNTLGDWWDDWGTSQSPGVGFQEYDVDVRRTTTVKGNYLFTVGIPTDEALGGDTYPDSYFRSTKPTYFPDSMAWPPIDVATIDTDMALSDSLIPAQVAYNNAGVWPGGGSSTTPKQHAGPTGRSPSIGITGGGTTLTGGYGIGN